MLKRTDKEKKVEELVQVLSAARGVYLADYSGLDVATITELRRICRDAGIRFEVIKNSLGRFAAARARMEGLPERLVGPTALATSEGDEISPARILTEFAKGHEGGPRIRAAYVEGELYDEAQVGMLASLPTRDVLLSNLLRAMTGTLTQLVGVLNAPLRDLSGVLRQVAEGREEGSGS
jgi:large subunit ribosomal protein L10